MAKKVITHITYLVLIAGIALGLIKVVQAATGNIDPTNKWAWGTNVGWINLRPEHGGVTVYADHLEGYAWAENIGWIRLGTHTGGGSHTYGNTSNTDYGVNRDASGNLSGYAWSTNVGWINFNPTHSQVTIDPATGSFDGYAWGENVGWIHFKKTTAPAYNVVAAPANLSVTKSVIPATAAPGDTITYTLTFSNAGSGTAFDVVITDTIPVSVTNTSVISSGVAVTYTGASPPYVWNVQDLAQGEGGVITLTGVLSDPLAAGTFTNTATITTTAMDATPGNNSGSAAVAVTVPPADLSITVTKTANVSAAEVGETITYTYRVTNSGNVTLDPIMAHDDQLGAVTLGATSLSPDAGTSGTLTHTVVEGDLPGPLANTVTVTGTPPVGSDVSATADESVVAGDRVALIDPTDGGSLDYTDPQAGITTTIDIPGGAVTETITLVYNELSSSTHPAPSGFRFAGRIFTLDAYLGDVLQPGYVFKTPITLTLTYNPDDLGNVDEETLELRYWDGSQWSSDGITVVERDTTNHRLVVTIAHLTEFALVGEQKTTSLYMPLVIKGFVYAPDLVVEEDSLVATSSTVTVTIRNQGNAAVTADFWVDVYFDPSQTPSLNHPWNTIASHGAVWGVTADIQAGGVLTLTSGGDYYVPEYSSTPPLPVGANVYALVDSVDYSTSYGAVWESNEGNNLAGPVTSTVGVASEAGLVVGQGRPASREGLPPR